MKNQIENLFPVVDLHVETDGKDRHWLTVEKLGQFFSSFNAMSVMSAKKKKIIIIVGAPR